jgi:DNA-binding transcriptional ArsR family regulator
VILFVKTEAKPPCAQDIHSEEDRPPLILDAVAVERTARLFRALGEAPRLRLVAHLAQAPACVTELAYLEHESVTVISQRLRVLRADNVVGRRRDGKHITYFLTDQHMFDLVTNGLAHAAEQDHSAPIHLVPRFSTNLKGEVLMATQHEVPENHPHQHGKDCGHTAIWHDDHTDYLHDGHFHSLHEGHVDEHALAVDATNPANCTNGHECEGHDAAHRHGADCGHEAVPHGNHVDYLVAGHLHHPDGDHCDNHGNVAVVS